MANPETPRDPSGGALPGAPLSYVLLVALAFLPYVFLPGNPLILDAQRSIVENPAVLEGSIGQILTTDYWGVEGDASYGTRSYRPFVTVTFAMQVALFGTDPASYHIVDMVLHAIGTILLALLIVALQPGSRWAIPSAALFAVHPVLSEAICSAVGRADLIAAIAMLAGVLLHVRAQSRARPWLFEAGALLLGVVALFSKEYAVTYPFMLIACDLYAWMIGRAEEARRRAYAVWGLALLALLIYLGARVAVLGELGGVPMLGEGDHPLYGKGFVARWSTASVLFLHALKLMVLPLGLNYFYGYGTLEIAESVLDPRTIAGVFALVGLVLFGLWALLRRRNLLPLVGATLVIFPLAPSLNTVSIAGVLFAERFLYLPAAGVLMIIAYLLSLVATTPLRRKLGLGLVVIVSVVFCGMTMARVERWESPKSLALASLEAYPNGANVLFELGLAYGWEGDDANALESFERSLAVQDNRPQVWKEYGVALMRVGRFEESVEAWRKSLQLYGRDDVWRLWRGLGKAELLAGKFEDAVRSLSRANDLEPEDPDTRDKLARALIALAQERVARGEPDAALAALERAIALEVMPPEGLFMAGLLARRAGADERADQVFALATERDPGLLRRRHEEAAGLDRAGRHLEAAERFFELVQAQPTHAPSLFNLGRNLLLGGRPSEAAIYLRRGLELRDDAGARSLLREAESRVQRQER